ncbi:MAG: acyltransferase [Candidatus Aenigmatarchaeota archaeon]
MIAPTAIIDKKAKIGEGTEVWNFVHVRENATIGKNCILAYGVYVDKNVKIGNNVAIQNKASIYRNAIIGDDVFIGPHVCFVNDKNPRSKLIIDLKDSTIVGKGASIGANSVLLPNVKIGDFALIGAGSVITKDIPAHALVYGNPATLRGFVCNCGKKLEKIKEGVAVVMACRQCKKKFDIPKKIYSEIK